MREEPEQAHSPKLGEVSQNKDYSILGSLLGAPVLGNSPMSLWNYWPGLQPMVQTQTKSCQGGLAAVLGV